MVSVKPFDKFPHLVWRVIVTAHHQHHPKPERNVVLSLRMLAHVAYHTRPRLRNISRIAVFEGAFLAPIKVLLS